MASKGSLKSTLAVSLNNYLDAGAIVAGGSGITLWQRYLDLTEMHLGWINALSANALGAAIGAIVGGFLADKFGRKFIFTYNLLVYMLGVLIVMLSVNFPMLLVGFLITGISVGIGVPASWTYISESSEVNNRGRNICISQMSWGFGPMIILLMGMLLAPGGYLFDLVKSVASLFTETAGYDIVSSALAALQGAGVEVAKLATLDEIMAKMTECNIPYEKEAFSAAYSVYLSVNAFSSRVVFFTLFVVAFIAWLLQRQLEESAEFKASKEAAKEKGEKGGLLKSFSVLFSNKVAVKSALFLAAIYLTWNLVASVMGFFSPHICETAGGVSDEYSNMMNCAQWATVVGVTFCVSHVVDKMSHKVLYILGLVFALATWVLVVSGGVNSMLGLWAFVILWGLNGGISVQIFYALWGSELFPAKFRAGAQGLMFFVVRGLSAAWGLAFTGIYGENGEGFTIAAYCMIALLVISLVVGVLGCPNTRGKSLDQIVKERYGDNY